MDRKKSLEEIIDSKNIEATPYILESYSRDESFVLPIRPRCIIKVHDAKEVQEVVKWANETLTPLVPVSSGGPHFRGDSVPSAGGAVIVDLSGMNKIVRVDSRNRVVMVEPGVTFGELQPVLEEAKLRMNMPLLPRLTKSVIGSALEREPVLMPKYHWDIADPLLCTEIIFGTGDMFRTGSAAGPGTLEEQWEVGAAQEIPSGPSQADWYRLIQGAQGTMGIVNWATIRCERLPKLEEAFLFSGTNLDKITELFHWLIRLRLVNECLVLNNTNLSSIVTKKWPQEYKDLRNSLPPWVLFACIAGYEYYPEDRVEYQTKEMLEIAQRLGIEPVKALGKVSAKEFLKMLKQPSSEPYWKLRYKGSAYDIFFLTVQEKLQGLIEVMEAVAIRHGYSASDIGVYIQPVVQGTSCHCEFNLFFDPKSEAEVERVRKLSEEAVKVLMERGAFFSRPYGDWADMAYRRDAETTAALRKLKSIFDPNNVMNPGKLCF